MRLKRTAAERPVARQVGGTRSTVQSTGNSTPTAFVRLRRICGMTLLSALLLSPAQAQPRISLHIQQRAFNGNLLKCADGTFIVEKRGELHRLTVTGAYERKLSFDPTHPVAAFTAYQTHFQRIFAPLADGGFFAFVDFDVPYLGWIPDRLARFDRDGRLVWADDRSYDSPVGAGAQLPDGRIIFGVGDARRMGGTGHFSWWALVGLKTNGYFYGSDIWGSTLVLALQGSNVLAGGNFALSQTPTQTVGVLRLNHDLVLDSSFRPPLCKDVSQLAVQSDGHIIVGGRLTNGAGDFESETSVFRLNSDGTFERRLLQTLPNDWQGQQQAPTFAIEADGKIIILYGGIQRYYPDGTLKETQQLSVSDDYGTDSYGYPFEAIEFLQDGSFLAHWFNNNAGGRDTGPHWVSYKPDGQIRPSFPPGPLNYVRTFLTLTNAVAGRRYGVEQSSDLVAWEKTQYYGWVSEPIWITPGWEFRIEETTKPQFFRVVEVPDF